MQENKPITNAGGNAVFEESIYIIWMKNPDTYNSLRFYVGQYLHVKLCKIFSNTPTLEPNTKEKQVAAAFSYYVPWTWNNLQKDLKLQIFQ